MKKIITLTVGIIFSLNVFSQNWLWAKQSTGTDYQEGYSVATDVWGNVYVTGSCQSPSITFGAYTLTNGGSGGNIFLVKYDPAGNVLWAKSAVGTGLDWGYSVATDASGNVYITGIFSSFSLIFGTYTVTSAGGHNFFLAKYDSAGTALWVNGVTSASGFSYVEGYGVGTDTFGNVYACGRYYSSAVFGTDTLISSGGSNDVFLVKYNSSGNELWAKSAGGTTDDRAISLATDLSGNVLVTGYFTSASFIIGADTLINGGGGMADVFLTKYNSAGGVLWAKSFGGTDDEFGNGVATDAFQNIYVTGFFSSSSVTIGTSTLFNTGVMNFFLVKYNPAGNVAWVNSATGTGQDQGYSVATNSAGNIFVSGRFPFGGGITFGSINLPYPTDATDPMFIVKYNSEGRVLCASALASGGDDQNGVATDNLDNAYVGGDFYGVNPFIVGTNSLTLTGTENVFIAKYNCGVMTNADEVSNKKQINLFPNPVTDELVVSSSEFGDKAVIEIYNVLGEKIYSQQQTTNDKQQTVDVSQLPSGIYFLKMRGEKEERLAKFVKQ